MPTLDLSRLDAADEERVLLEERSFERFDRLAFAQRAVELVRPSGMTVAICSARSRLRVDAGRVWGRAPGASWAVVHVPPDASRRAIALAVTQLGLGPRDPFRVAPTTPEAYALDVLVAESQKKDP